MLWLHLTLNGSHTCWAEKMKYKMFKFAIVSSWDFINFAEGPVSRTGLEVERSGPFMTYDLSGLRNLEVFLLAV